jgi:hypothetical protein
MRATPAQRATKWIRIEVFMAILLSFNGSLVPFSPRIDSDLDLRCGDEVSGERPANP